MEDLDTNRIKMESFENQSVRNNDVNTIYIKEELIEFEEDVINMKQEVKKEIFPDDHQDGYDQRNNLIDIKHEAIEYIKEEIQPELGFSTEDIQDSKTMFDSYRNSYLKRPLRIHHTNKQYLGSKSFSKSSSAIKHLSTHSQDKRPTCKVCEKSFSSKSNLSVHLRLHFEDNPYHCDICMKSFSQRSNFTSHLRMHSEDKSYRCDICKKSFSRSSILTEHLRIHSGDKPYQ